MFFYRYIQTWQHRSFTASGRDSFAASHTHMILLCRDSHKNLLTSDTQAQYFGATYATYKMLIPQLEWWSKAGSDQNLSACAQTAVWSCCMSCCMNSLTMTAGSICRLPRFCFHPCRETTASNWSSSMHAWCLLPEARTIKTHIN
jgi:hypothetical protein